MGQKKKAFMCFALAANTSLLIMDEPTNGLDIPSKSQFRQVVSSCMNDDRTNYNKNALLYKFADDVAKFAKIQFFTLILQRWV